MANDGDQETTKEEDEGESIAFLMRVGDLDSMAEIGGDGIVADLGHKAVKVVGMATGYERVEFLTDLELWTESGVRGRGRRWFWSKP
ncbi:tetraacyldisaccharide 4-kinase [Sesbania bispinosa]|nr:tetraacyldisaccharide 4-kinase [Sesbania bispinosa]